VAAEEQPTPCDVLHDLRVAPYINISEMTDSSYLISGEIHSANAALMVERLQNMPFVNVTSFNETCFILKISGEDGACDTTSPSVPHQPSLTDIITDLNSVSGLNLTKVNDASYLIQGSIHEPFSEDVFRGLRTVPGVKLTKMGQTSYLLSAIRADNRGNVTSLYAGCSSWFQGNCAGTSPSAQCPPECPSCAHLSRGTGGEKSADRSLCCWKTKYIDGEPACARE